MQAKNEEIRNITLWQLLPMLFCSGLCSLAYQLVWMRELRLIFGSSTMATSAVLAIFMGGIGFGSIYLGRTAEQHRNPLRLYGYFELVIALSAFLTPFLILFAENLYLKTGGYQSLGYLPATLLRLFLSTLVLGVPTFFMGGTLPAIAKTALREIDLARRDLGFLYAINTLGAVTGAWLVVFVMLESFGSQNTLIAAGLLNLLVAVIALIWSRLAKNFHASIEVLPVYLRNNIAHLAKTAQSSLPSPNYVNGATCLAGFCFFFMEIVWYRMLTPLLGGTTYTMGIILAVALLGLALGAWGYGVRRYTVKTSLRILSLVCGLEALFMAVPFALGDRIAVLTSLLRPIGAVGMAGYVVGWLVITTIVVLPTAIVAGYQFPLLIGLKGKGRKNIAIETGQVYAWNTIGAITGSLVGGIMLIPLIGATVSWQLNVLLLSLLSVSTIIVSIYYEGTKPFLALPGGIIFLAIMLLMAKGPTATWRHTPIGVGLTDISKLSHNEIQDWINETRRYLLWEKDGREASIALEKRDGLSFKVNGKVDGNIKGDAGTQILAPLIGAILHPNPQKALVIGLGTGSSSGWLASIDSISSVDTIEIEPAIVEVAKLAAPMNKNALKNKKVKIIHGDAREVILINKKTYDLIFSEPSNPYRAGIASLYTKEFYQSVAKRLNKNGYFSQWVQGYQVDTQTIKTIYATLSSVFPVVETWETNVNDLLFICSMQETEYSVPKLRRKVKQEPFRSALLFTAGIIDLEGLMAHYSANSTFSRRIAAEKVEINSDNQMLVEFGFARSLGREKLFSIADIRYQAEKKDEHLPQLRDGRIDWDRVAINRRMKFPMSGEQAKIGLDHNSEDQLHTSALNLYVQGETLMAIQAWQQYGKEPEYPFEILIVAEALADQGVELSEKYITQLMKYWPLTAEAVRARLYWRKGDRQKAFQAIEKVLTEFRTNPWAQKEVMIHTLFLAREMAEYSDKITIRKLYELLSEPFSLYILDAQRLKTLNEIALKMDDPKYIADVIMRFEPNPPWNKDFLTNRLKAYRSTGNPMLKQAEEDLRTFMHNAPERFTVN
jgi:predicted membrane-bound spermidine synthase/tetratricopeptide (TPR) repeat protein